MQTKEREMRNSVMICLLAMVVLLLGACARVEPTYVGVQHCPRLQTLNNIKQCKQRVALLSQQIAQYNRLFAKEKK